MKFDASFLNGGIQSAGDIQSAFKSLDRAFNCYSSYSRMWEDAYAELTEEGKNAAWLCMCVAALAMVQYCREVRNGEPTWDNRYKASEAYAAEHLGLFRKKLGTGCPESIVRNGDVASEVVSSWMTVHSTLKQAIFGGFVNGVACHEDGFESGKFPFI